MARLNRFAAASALAAAFSLAATPAMARGYHHHWQRWHRDRVDGGDILAGALIIGGIAAIASAASNRDREERQSVPPPVPEDRQGYAYDGADRNEGLDRAADICADAVERGPNRVDSVDNVTRDRDGWEVSGALENGAGFSCRIGNDGKVQGVNVAGPRDDAYADRAPQAQDDEPGVDNRPEWRDDDAQPQPQDDERYSTSEAPDFGDET
uniref:hypothetical protein n=1 Tax=Altererythrobacter segetis TaxID=1104773 RepID=UPI00140CA6C1|nr:hypothetical protein [Altererythrobacter segetis]